MSQQYEYCFAGFSASQVVLEFSRKTDLFKKITYRLLAMLNPILCELHASVKFITVLIVCYLFYLLKTFI